MQREELAPIIENVLEKNGIGLCVCGLEGILHYVNKAFNIQFDIEDKPGAPAVDIHDIAPALGDILDVARNDKAGLYKQISVTARSGFIRRLGILLSMTDDAKGRAPVVTIITYDISRYIPESGEEQWHDIVDGLEDGFYECDLRGFFVNANRAFCRITEYEYHELIGLDYKKLYTPDDGTKIYSIYHDVFESGKPNRFVDCIAITKTGKMKSIECSISPVRGADGKIRAFRGIVRDVSDKNRIEKELQHARKFEAIGILSGGIAHDYNNVLTAIMGNISLAKMEVDPENRSLMEVLNDAEEASARAVELTRRLSIFARGGKPERIILSYGESLRNIVDSVLRNYKGTYTVIIEDGLWDTDIDEFQIGQAITYILDNAVESMPKPGSITITAENVVMETEMSHHEITLQPGKYVRISIGDEGIGIPPENISSIFDPYFTTKEMASGMGLATSYAIIKRHHGYIDVKTSMGKGSVFYVYLPASLEQHRT